MKIPSFYFGAPKKTMDQSVIYKEKEEFKEVHWVLNNAHSNKFYEFSFEMSEFPNIRILKIGNLKEIGLSFDQNKISGTPTVNNVYHLEIEFYHIGDEKNVDVKKVDLFVNADPKVWWKNFPGDDNDVCYKPDETPYKGRFSDKKIVVTSR
ncbi:hypothetical protein [Chryseobacterium indologenes]|uniref:hypothetical protein n=1 Tax=Chryseobacterium indologenes TaxID=253 RepID=UPI001625C38C|nr:hypothetical protein [Chryseobacterium indologenes]